GGEVGVADHIDVAVGGGVGRGGDRELADCALGGLGCLFWLAGKAHREPAVLGCIGLAALRADGRGGEQEQRQDKARADHFVTSKEARNLSAEADVTTSFWPRIIT